MALLETLQRELAAREIDYYLVPSSDEHLNEYLPEHAKRLARVSGFDGSAGDALVGRERSWLFVDGRYHVQAESQVDGARFAIHKVGLAKVRGCDQQIEALARERPGARFAVDPFVIPCARYRRLEALISKASGRLIPVSPNLVDAFWEDRPARRSAPIESLPEEVCGASVAWRLARVRERLAEEGAAGTVALRLDQVAWLLGRRGADIVYNPVFESALALTAEAALLFVKDEHAAAFAELEGIALRPLSELTAGLAELAGSGGVWRLDPNRLTEGLAAALEAIPGVEVQVGVDLIEELKACKNPAELAGMRRAGRRASAAKACALRWLDEQVAAGAAVSERAFRDHLEACYAARPDFRGLSFSIIAGAGANGAIVHYSEPSDAALIKAGELFLVDSGAHYLGGTTDATRTVSPGGAASEEQRRVYSLVLKGHVSCARAVFPAGTNGAQLDALTRAPLWQEGLDYIHGTGHGVGAYLNVHEGPISIGLPSRGASVQRALEPGQVVSIEPGYYREGWGGVRIENLYAVVTRGQDELGRRRLGFEPCNWLPFDRRLIALEMLTKAEAAWVDAYHQSVLEELTGPGCGELGLEEADRAWLRRACAPLGAE